MLLNLLVVRAGVTDSCGEIDFLCVSELLWARIRSCQMTGRRIPGERITNFRQFVSRRKDELNIQADHVFKMDEVPISFDAPYSRTVDTTGAESIPVSTTSHKKTGFTVVLACSELGNKLKPIVIFKRKTMPKENLPAGVVHCHNKGWMDRHGMAVWGAQVWRARPVSFFDRTSLLIFDSFSAHIDEGVRNHFKAEHKTTTAVIPGGLTKNFSRWTFQLINHLRIIFAKSGRSGCHKEFKPSQRLEK